MNSTGLFASLNVPYEPLGEPVTDLEAMLNTALSLPVPQAAKSALKRRYGRGKSFDVSSKTSSSKTSDIASTGTPADIANNKVALQKLKAQQDGERVSRCVTTYRNPDAIKILDRLQKSKIEMQKVQSGVDFEGTVFKDADDQERMMTADPVPIEGVMATTQATLESALSFPVQPNARRRPKSSRAPTANQVKYLRMMEDWMYLTKIDNGEEEEIFEYRAIDDEKPKKPGSAAVPVEGIRPFSAKSVGDELDMSASVSKSIDDQSSKTSSVTVSKDSFTSSESIDKKKATRELTKASEVWNKLLQENVQKFKEKKAERESELKRGLAISDKYRLENYNEKTKIFNNVISRGNMEVLQGVRLMSKVRNLAHNKRARERLRQLDIIWADIDDRVFRIEDEEQEQEESAHESGNLEPEGGPMVPEAEMNVEGESPQDEPQSVKMAASFTSTNDMDDNGMVDFKSEVELTESQVILFDACRIVKTRIDTQLRKWINEGELVFGANEMDKLASLAGEDIKVDRIQLMLRLLKQNLVCTYLYHPIMLEQSKLMLLFIASVCSLISRIVSTTRFYRNTSLRKIEYYRLPRGLRVFFLQIRYEIL